MVVRGKEATDGGLQVFKLSYETSENIIRVKL